MKKILLISLISLFSIIIIVVANLSLNSNDEISDIDSVEVSYDISISDAFDLLLSEVLGENTEGKRVFVHPDLLNPNSIVLPDPYNLVSSPDIFSWFFFIDDFPNANWSHPCRYVFVELNKNITVIDAGWMPDREIELLELKIEENNFFHNFYTLDQMPVGDGLYIDLEGKSLVLTTYQVFPCCNYYILANKTIIDDTIIIDVKGVFAPDICLTALGSASYTSDLSSLKGNYKLLIEYDREIYGSYYLNISDNGVGFIKGRDHT
jgi:hypothetical protein